MRWAEHPAVAWAFGVLAFALPASGAYPYANGFNDGSRLATAESLIDRGTLSIDESLFLHPPPEYAARGMDPYAPTAFHLNGIATYDMVRIEGRFYSDKPMVPAVALAGAYRALMVVGFPAPTERPDVFCRTASVLYCGLAYAVAVGCMWELGRRAGLGAGWRFVWLVGFALGGVLPAYTRHVNPAMPQLAAVAALALLLSRSAGVTGRTPWSLLVAAGCCAGFAYAVDLGSGPPLLAFAAAAVAVRTRRVAAVAAFLLGALPWVAANHGLCYAVGRVWVPLGMVPEYLEWPGSMFNRTNMTGASRHTAATLAAYAGDLLYGPNGFLVCNLPLALASAFGWLAVLYRGPDRVEQAALLLWCATVWVVYAALSDNAAGVCLSIRWFVPLFVPGFWAIARLMAVWPSFRLDFLVLGGCGLVLGYRLWDLGPWFCAPLTSHTEIVRNAALAWVAVRAALISVWLVRVLISGVRA